MNFSNDVRVADSVRMDGHSVRGSGLLPRSPGPAPVGLT